MTISSSTLVEDCVNEPDHGWNSSRVDFLAATEAAACGKVSSVTIETAAACEQLSSAAAVSAGITADEQVSSVAPETTTVASEKVSSASATSVKLLSLTASVAAGEQLSAAATITTGELVSSAAAESAAIAGKQFSSAAAGKEAAAGASSNVGRTFDLCLFLIAFNFLKAAIKILAASSSKSNVANIPTDWKILQTLQDKHFSWNLTLLPN